MLALLNKPFYHIPIPNGLKFDLCISNDSQHHHHLRRSSTKSMKKYLEPVNEILKKVPKLSQQIKTKMFHNSTLKYSL